MPPVLRFATHRHSFQRFLSAAAFSCAAITTAFSQTAPAPAETVRPELAKPLQAAREAIQNKNNTEALARLREADALPDKTPYESFIIERLRAPAAAASGDQAGAAKAIEFLLASERLSPAERLSFSENLLGLYSSLNEHKKVISLAERLLAGAGSGNAHQYRLILMRSAIAAEEWSVAAKAVDATIAEGEKNGRVPAEPLLKARAGIASKQNDVATYLGVIEKLAVLYPTPDHWREFIARSLHPETFALRHTIDLLRLKLALGTLKDAEEATTLAELALQAGFPVEADRAMKFGFAKELLGKGPDAAKHAALRDKAAREAADDAKNLARTSKEAAALKEGPALFNAGYNLALHGDAANGLPMMEQGLMRPGLRNAEDLRLRLGMAYALARQSDKARETLALVKAADGGAGLARLWTAFAQRAPTAQ